jgi:signal transduction histidine kinase
MKIKVYNQLLAASTLASGMIIFVALWHQNQKVEEISRAHFESRLIVQTIEHLFTMSQTWLTTQDLLFAGQQTYLANGITKQSKQLSETLLTIDVNVVSQSSHQLIEKLQAAISKNDVIVNSFSQFSIIDNKTWQAAIGQSDRVTTDYIKTLEQLLSETSKNNLGLAEKLTLATEHLSRLTWMIISLYLLFVLFVVNLFSKYIVRPIEEITASAMQSGNTRQTVDFTQEKAPSEVIALSNAIDKFTRRITIEKQKAQQEQVKALNMHEKVNTMMETIPCALLLLDNNGLIKECNPETSLLFSTDKVDIIDQNIAIFLPAMGTLDGKFDQEMALKNTEESLLAPGFNNPYIEFSGREIHLKGQQNFLMTITDINERKHSQKALSALNEQLINAEKLASIGQLSAGIAHEINNPIGFVRSNIDVLNDYMKSMTAYIEVIDKDQQSEKARELYQQEDLAFIITDIDQLIAATLKGADRVSKIIKDLGNYAHPDNAIPEPICIDNLIEQSLNLVANELQFKVEFIQSLQAKVNIIGFRQQLLQVFINLLVNASHAIEGQGKITINSRVENNEVNICFKDNGVGITEKHLQKIFDPFFTTKPLGKGTGLGLHRVRTIIEEHQGRIDVNSSIGKGSTFSIFLPIDLPA